MWLPTSGSCVQSPDTLPCLLNTNRPQMLSRRWWKVPLSQWNAEQTFFDQLNPAEQMNCKIQKLIRPSSPQVPSVRQHTVSQFSICYIVNHFYDLPPKALPNPTFSAASACILCGRGGGGWFLQGWLHQAELSSARNCFHLEARQPIFSNTLSQFYLMHGQIEQDYLKRQNSGSKLLISIECCNILLR